MNLSFLPETAFLFMLIFARLGTMIMLMPALGETNVPGRIRLTLALSLTLVLYPIVSVRYSGGVPAQLMGIFVLLGGELIIGFFIGLATRLVMAAVQIAGTIIAGQTGLAFAMAFDPAQGQQGVIFSNFLSLLAITLIFVTDLHYLLVGALHDSFTLFPPGDWMSVDDLAQYAVRTVAEAFTIGVRLSAPFIVFGLVFYFGLGLLNRLMPQMQIFFIAMPANIFLGIGLLMLLLATMMTWYMGHVEATLGQFLAR